jgi:hypothetical protein
MTRDQRHFTPANGGHSRLALDEDPDAALAAENPDRTVRFQMVWPAWLAAKAARAARSRALSQAAWLREAALEKIRHEESSS